MLQENIGSSRALLHLLDVLPVDGGSSVLEKLGGTLERTRRILVRSLTEEMNQLVKVSCEEVAAITGVTPEHFFAFSHPDCKEKTCRGSRVEILRVDRAVGGELACLCRVFRTTRVTAHALRPFRLVALSGQLETPQGLIESGQAVLVSPDAPVSAFPGATFLIPNPMATFLICDAVQAGFPLRSPGRDPIHLTVVSRRLPARIDETE